MKIINYNFTKSNALDYINKDQKIMQFYPSHFKDRSSWQNIMDKLKNNTHDYECLVDILKRQNIDFSADKKVIDTIEQLSEKNTYAIVTGQQVGIFTGPLYTIYKAATAIKLSIHLSQKFGAKFIPIFWMESNDHDIKEVNHLYITDSESNLVKLEYTPSGYKPGSQMKNVVIEEDFLDFVHDFNRHFHDTEFKTEIFEIIRESYQPSQNLCHAFARMMCRLFSKYGLVILDPSDTDIKKLMIPIFKQEIEHPLRSTKSINALGEKLRSCGYDSQIEKSEDSINLFIEENGIRRKLFYSNGYFKIEGNEKDFTRDQLLEILNISPQRFSPNVALRPIAQDYILPTVVYIAGPGEISYFAQLGELYQYNNVDMPIIYPRESLIIIENKIQKIIDAYNLDISDLALNYEELFSKISRQKVSKDIENIIEYSRYGVEEIFDKLIKELSNFDPDLKNISESVKKKIEHQLSILREKAYQVKIRRDEVTRNQIKRACVNIFPDSKPQERVFNIVQYLVLYGLQIIESIMSAIKIHEIS